MSSSLTPNDCLQDALALGKWIVVVDARGNHIWYRSVEDTVRREWVEYRQIDENTASHLVPRSRVREMLRQREPDYDLVDEPPEAMLDE